MPMHRVDLKPPVSTVCKNKTSKFFRFYVKFDFKSRLGASEEGLFLKAYLKLLTNYCTYFLTRPLLFYMMMNS